MRIKKLEVENITSLKGRHLLNFDKDLMGEELFAITGPTGSGKSTLLSAISLALYGQNYKTSLNSADFVSQDQTVGKIELTFALGGHTYLAKWKCKTKKKNGDPIKRPVPIREFYCDEQPIEDSPEDIIGLDFDQFCKTVILNQNQFSEFILAPFRERRDILEKIYQQSELSLLSLLVGRKIKEIETQISTLNERLDAGQALTEEQLQKIESELKNETENQTKLVKEFEAISEFDKCFNELHKLAGQRDNSQKKQNELQNSLDNIHGDLNQAKQLFEAAQIKKVNAEKELWNQRPLYEKAILKLEEIKQEQRHLNTLENALKELKQREKQLGNNKSERQVEQVKCQEKIDQIQHSPSFKLFGQEKADKIAKHEQSWEKLHYQQNLTDQNQHSLVQKLKQHEIKHQQLTDSLSKLTATIKKTLPSELKDQLGNNPAPRELPSELMRKQRSLAPLIGLRRELHSWIEELVSTCQLKSKDANRLNQLKADLEQSESRIAEILRQKEAAELEIKQAQLQQAIIVCKKASLRSDNCVVCGHEHQLEEDESESEKTIQLEKIETAIEQLNARLHEERRLGLEIQSEYSLTERTILEHENKLLQLGQKIDSAWNQVFGDNKNTPKTTEDKIKFLSEKLEQSTQLEKTIEQTCELLAPLVERLQTLAAQVASSENELKFYRNSLAKGQAELSKQALECSTLKDSVRQLIGRDIEQLTQFKSFTAQLKKEQEQYQHLLIQSDSLKKEISYFQTEQETNAENIKKLTTERDESLQGLEKLKTELPPEAQVEGGPQKALEAIDNTHKESSKNWEKAKANFDSIQKEKDFLSNSLHSVNEQLKDLALLMAPLDRELCSLLNHFDFHPEISEKISEGELVKKDAHSLELLKENYFTPFYSNKKAALADLTQKVTIESTKLEMAKQAFERAKETQGRVKRLTQDLNKYNLMQQILGKNEFRNFALGKIEDILIQFANTELETLCDGRYKIISVPKKQGNDFYITDSWHGDLPRKLSTLSGGETFLVSLAMALALAEMSRGQTEIDSFFIDEGFGSLDQDSINVVLDCLLSIRSRGKQIGIISHVKSLTDRIAVNYTLSKAQTGSSELEVLYN